MSQNNTIRKSDKKFIRTEKARIRSQFLDIKKQEELIDNLYKKFLPQPKTARTEEIKEVKKEEVELKKAEIKKEEKLKPKKEKIVKKAK